MANDNNDNNGTISLGNISNITKLDRTNYKNWVEDIEIELKLRRVHKAVVEDNVDEMIDLQARRIILETMDKDHRAQVRGYRTAKEIMDRLRVSYAEATESRKYRTLVKFFRYTKLQSDDISTHVGKLEGLRADLLDLDIEFDEDIFLATVIGSLPPEYGNIMETWELAAPQLRTKQNLIAKLLNKEADMATGGLPAGHVLAAAKGKSRLTREEILELKKTSKCGYCKEIGHWHKECPRKPADSSTSEVPKQPKKVSLNVGVISTELKAKWVCDSGATSNMCNQRSWFTKLFMFTEPSTISIGDGSTIEVLGIGTIRFTSMPGTETVDGTLTDVLYIPALATNLVSVPAVSRKGVTVMFDELSCKFVQNEEVILTGTKGMCDLYILDMQTVEPATGQALITNLDRTKQEWHEAFGHQSSQRVDQLLKDLKIGVKPRVSQDGKPCPTCPQGKMRHATHPSSTEPRARNVGDKVHIDLVHSDNKDQPQCYFMLSKDEASEYCLVHFLSSKTDVCDAVTQLIIDFEVGSGNPIRVIQSDNGTEFINQKMRRLLQYEHIGQHTSTAYTPQQNGIIERAVQTVCNSARAMLLASKLPRTLLNEAIRTACYLINRLPTKRSKITPFERFTGRPPFIGHLVRFGEPAHMLLTHMYLRKFDARTVTCFAVGYTERRNTYRVYVPKLEKVIESCDLVFAPHKNDAKISEDSDSPRVQLEAPVIHCASYCDNEDSDEEDYNQITPSAPTFDNLDQSDTEILQRTSTPLANRAHGKNNRPYVTSEQLQQFMDQFRRENQTQYETASDDSHRDTITDLDEPAQTSTGCALTDPNDSQRLNRPTSNLMMFAMLADSTTTEPQNYEEAVNGPDRQAWKEAIQAELAAHSENKTWSVTKRPKTGTMLTAKWVFKRKRDSAGRVDRYKARLVARGFEQRAGIDFKETFAPVAMVESIRALIALAAIKQLETVQFDVATAFLNGELDEKVYIEAPAGVQIQQDECLCLHKALYGLKQAPRAWSSKFCRTLKAIGFQPTASDPCVFASSKHDHFVVTYVDDGMIMAKNKVDCQNIVKQLDKHFKTNIVEGSVFLGIEILRAPDGTFQMHQARYIEDALLRFKLTDVNPKPTPLADITRLRAEQDSPRTTAPYRAAIGSLLYLALNTRPDILFPTIALSCHNSDPKESHWNAVKRIWRYIRGTKDLALTFRPEGEDVKIEAYADADWGGDSRDGTSTSGVMILINNCPIVIKSIRQQRVALSTCEAEFVAAASCVKELLWLTGLLRECRVEHVRPTLYIDNKSALATIKSQTAHKGLKHIRLRQSFLKDEFESGTFELKHICSEDNPADILTKTMTAKKLETLLPKMGVSKKLPTATAACMALILLALPLCNAVKITVLKEIEWVPSRYVTASTTKKCVVIIPNVNRCEMLRRSFEGQIVQDARIRSIIDNMVIQCNKSRNKTYIPMFERLKTLDITRRERLTRETTDSHLGRPLREAASPAAFWSTWLFPAVQSASEYQNSESAYNTVWSHEKLLNQVFKRLNDHHERFKEIQQGNNNSLDALRLMLRELNSTVTSNDQVIANLPLFMRTTAEIGIELQRDVDLMYDLASSLQQGLVDLNALRKMHIEGGGAGLDKLDARLCQLNHFRYRQRFDKFELLFEAMIKDKPTTIFKAIAFKSWNGPDHYRIYTGNKLLLYNEETNCSKLLPEPTEEAYLPLVTIDENCTTQNQTTSIHDMEFIEVQVNEQNRQQAIKPLLYKVGSERLIQCYQHEITIEGVTASCIEKPFSIPATATIRIGDITHIVELEETALNFTNKEHRQIEKGRLSEAFLEAMEEASSYIKESDKRNKKLQEMNEKEEQDKLMQFANEHLEAAIGIGSIVLMFLSLIIGLWIYKSCREDPMLGVVRTALLTSALGMAKSMPNLTETSRPTHVRSKSYVTLSPMRMGSLRNMLFDTESESDEGIQSTGRLYPDLNTLERTQNPDQLEDELGQEQSKRVTVAAQFSRADCETPSSRPSTPHPLRKPPRIRYNGRQTRG